MVKKKLDITLMFDQVKTITVNGSKWSNKRPGHLFTKKNGSKRGRLIDRRRSYS